MIVHPLAAVKAGGAGGLDDGLEIPVIGLAEDLGKVAVGPEFIARRVRPADGFKGCDFFAHGSFHPSAFILYPYSRSSCLTRKKQTGMSARQCHFLATGFTTPGARMKDE